MFIDNMSTYAIISRQLFSQQGITKSFITFHETRNSRWHFQALKVVKNLNIVLFSSRRSQKMWYLMSLFVKGRRAVCVV